MRERTNFLQVEVDRVLIGLFCCYALSLPFELILEILLNIKTVFKPFRVISIAIILTFGVKIATQGLVLNKANRIDWFLYAVFIYGIIISCFKIISGVFNMNLFLNDVFQFSLHVATFFIYKSISITKNKAFTIFNWFMIGIFLNALYISYRFLSFGVSRDAGFTDNPNYAAFCLVSVTTFLLLKSNFQKIWKDLLAAGLLILFFLYTFGIQGSRTGLIMFVIASAIVFFFSSFKRKFAILLGSSLIVLLLIPGLLFQNEGSSSIVLINRLQQKSKSNTEDVRFVIWKGVGRIMETEGYEGMGIGQFKAKFSQYYAQESNQLILAMIYYGYFLSTHNDYLAILTDFGLPGLLFYLAFIGFTFWKLIIQIRSSNRNGEEVFLGQFCFIFFSCIVVFGLTNENFVNQFYWFLLMFTTKNYD